MTEFKKKSTHLRAVDALKKLAVLVVDKKDELADCIANLDSMNAAEIMAELKSWRDDCAMMPEWRRVLNQHGFY